MGRYTVRKEEFDKEVTMPVSRADSRWLAVLLAVFMAVALSACGGGGSGTTQMPEPVPPPTAEEMCTDAGNHWVDGACLTPQENTVNMTLASIAAAATAADAQAAYDAVKDQVTAAQGEQLQMAVDARGEELATMARVDEQKQALMDAAGMIDTSDLSTQALVDAARTAIAGLRQAIDDAVDVDDTSMYQTQLNNAEMAVDTAQGGINTATRRTNQMTALSDASGDLQDALAALSGATPTQALLDAANNALTALNTAIADGADLTDDEKAPYQREANNAAAPIQMAQTAFNNAVEEQKNADIAAMAVTAAKLHTGIAAQNGDPTTTAAGTALSDGERAAAYNNADVPSGNTPATPIDTRIMVGMGTATPVALSEDKDATVPAHHGWTGMMFKAEPDGDGTYEAVVYSHVGEATVTEGLKFGSSAANDDYQYTLDAQGNTELTMNDANAGADWEERVASPSFDQDAGIKEFEKGSNDERVEITGSSYHGVSGTYYCAPAADSTCAVQVATDGFTLGGTADADNSFTTGGGTWTFKASSNEAQLMDTSAPDGNYASYGWWLHKSEDDDDYTASAFHDYKGTDPGTVGITDLRGTAEYRGGAAGKYALRSSTGGTNDAGHFIADVVLNAEFGEDHTIDGTINNFMGADGESRDWSVALSESTISDTGVIAGDPETTSDTANQMTTWTIDATEGDAAGAWSGNLREQGDDGVPAIATGTFYSEYGGPGGLDGKMVGAFGANKPAE